MRVVGAPPLLNLMAKAFWLAAIFHSRLVASILLASKEGGKP
jgi:hypothetical protein